MARSTAFQIAVLPGDGIGVEVTDAALEVLKALTGRIGGFDLAFTRYAAGARAYQQTGTALSEQTLGALERAVERCFSERRVLPAEFGGSSGTSEMTRAVIDALGR